MIRKLITTLILICWSSQALAATTWYVRADGGTIYNAGSAPSGQCSGTVDAAYPGSGINQPCAVNHPFQIIRHQTDNVGGTSGITYIAGGDTVIFGTSDGAGGSTDQFEMGVGSVVWPGCNMASYPFGCFMDSLPSGPDAAHPTRILGRGYDTGCTGHKVQFWGVNQSRTVFYNNGNSNLDFECMDVTDHSSCVYRGPLNSCVETTTPRGPYAQTGMTFNTVTNVTMKYMDIHGFADRGVYTFHPAGTWNWDYVKIIANAWAGVDLDDPATTNDAWNLATFNISNSKINQSGCQEKYPLVGALGSTSNLQNCSAQGQGVFTDGWGAGDAACGNVNIVNSEMSWNTQDGFDNLHCHGSGFVKISRSRFEGNSGNQVKVNGILNIVENSTLIGNCGYYYNPRNGTGQTFTNLSTPNAYDNTCRGAGMPFVVSNSVPGQQSFLYGNTITSNGDVLVEFGGPGTTGCDGNTKLVSRNNVYLGGDDINGQDTTGLFFNDGQVAPCLAVTFNDDYSQVFNIKEGAGGVTGAHSRYGDPKLTGQSSLNQTTAPWYRGNVGVNLVPLSATSPSRFAVTGANSADESLTFTSFGTADYNGTSRGANWDGGAFQFGSCTNNGSTCSINTDCCSNSCTGSICTPIPTCSSNGISCSSNSECCTNYCSGANVCDNPPTCGSNGTGCSLGADCCSGFCVASICSATSGSSSFAIKGALGGVGGMGGVGGIN